MAFEAIWHERIIPESRHVLYEYDELSESVKDSVREEFLNLELATMVRYAELHDIFKHTFLDYFFPKSDIKVEWSLSSSQGDGVNIYGNFFWGDVIDFLKNHNQKDQKIKINPWLFTDEEETKIREYSNFLEIEVNPNYRYSYCVVDNDFFLDDWRWALEDAEVKDIDYNLLERLDKVLTTAIYRLCREMEDYGYNFLYELSDDEMSEIACNNEWLYYEDGTLYEGGADELVSKIE